MNMKMLLVSSILLDIVLTVKDGPTLRHGVSKIHKYVEQWKGL